MMSEWDGEDEFEDVDELDDDEEDEEYRVNITVKGLQVAVDEAGKRFDNSEEESIEQYLATLDLIIFSQYAMMRGWEMINRLVIGADGGV